MWKKTLKTWNKFGGLSIDKEDEKVGKDIEGRIDTYEK